MPNPDFDPDWPHGHTTRNGRKARIICKDLVVGLGTRIVAAIMFENGQEEVREFYASGHRRAAGEGPDILDLLNAPVPPYTYEPWVLIYSLSECREPRHVSSRTFNNVKDMQTWIKLTRHIEPVAASKVSINENANKELLHVK